MTAASRCRSCSAPIVWAVTTHGKRMPLDVDPVADGNVVILATVDGAPLVQVVTDQGDLFTEPPGDPLTEDPVRFVPHFATCPNADAHRRPR